MNHVFALNFSWAAFAVLVCSHLFLLINSDRIATAQALPSTELATRLEKMVQGDVFNADGQPVENFQATIKIVRRDRHARKEQILSKWSLKGIDGKFQNAITDDDQILFESAAKPSHHPPQVEYSIVASISANGYVHRNIRIPASQFDGQFPVCQLREAVKIIGHFKAPSTDNNQQPIAGYATAIEILGVLPTTEQYEHRFAKTAALDENGNLELWAPKSSHLFLTVHTNSSAPWTHQLTATPDETAKQSTIDIGEHSLPTGAVVKGIVVDRDNSPVARQVVQLYQHRNDVQFMDTSIRSYAVTNSLGQFKFPPSTGKVQISLVNEGILLNGNPVFTPQGTPAATPIKLNLEPGLSSPYLEIKEARHHNVYGTVQTPENTAPAAITIRLWRPQDPSPPRRIPVHPDGSFKFDLVQGTDYRMSFRHESQRQASLAILGGATNAGHAAIFSDSPLVPTRSFKIKPLETMIGPLQFIIMNGQ